jgi:threonine dehydratase
MWDWHPQHGRPITAEQLPDPVSLADVEAAHARIAPVIHRTPLLSSTLLNEHTGATLLFKCENLQKIGAFKARGANNAVIGLSDEIAAKGVATHSSGNHGAALAQAAARRGIPAWVVMPGNAPAVKRAAVESYGATIVECDGTLEARETTLEAVIAEHGAHVVHPYDDERVIAGQGTVALEILDELDDLDVIAIPVGGGGLLAGMALTIKARAPHIEVLGVEPAGADDAFRSFGTGVLQPSVNPQTIADGLRAGVGVRNFALMQRYVDTIVTVSEEAIVEAMRLQWTRMKTVVEPSGAVAFAGVLEHGERFRGRRAALVVTGGNVDIDRLPW